MTEAVNTTRRSAGINQVTGGYIINAQSVVISPEGQQVGGASDQCIASTIEVAMERLTSYMVSGRFA